jgi:prevent-host-death family protein
MDSPHIIAITELRRSTSSVINGPVAQGIPVFVTQRGYVAAVMVSRAVFDRMARSERQALKASASDPEAADAAAPAATGIESFGPLPPDTLFETPWNLVDAETAAFFMADGIPVRPYLKGWVEDGPLPAWEPDGQA